jgi:hypothetical protein
VSLISRLAADQGIEIFGSEELLDILIAAHLAQNLGRRVVLPLEDVAGGFAIDADKVFGCGHDTDLLGFRGPSLAGAGSAKGVD